MKDVILTGIRGDVGNLVLSALRSKGLDVVVYDPLPKAGSRKYRDGLLALVEKTGARVVMPVFFPEVVAHWKAYLPEGTVLAAESEEKLSLLDNKVSASALAAECGIPQPGIYSDADDIPVFPCVFKRATGLGGAAVYFPKTRQALDNLISKAGRRNPYMMMDFIEGYDCSVDAIRFGDYFEAVAYRIILPKQKGFSSVRMTVDAPELRNYVKTLLDRVDYNGVCGVDFRIDREGRPYFLECNPRFSGGLRSTLKSGLNLPHLLYQFSVGENTEPVTVIRRGLSVDWKRFFHKG
ncbi:MAG: ATP-grasp domain-containing protein [Bacteroidales bacterium]|nr:ATP-grasp domain-containing protein [Bacteroidales bacterium]